MTTSLPPVISSYFTAAEHGDVDALVGCFTDDAVTYRFGLRDDRIAELRIP